MTVCLLISEIITEVIIDVYYLKFCQLPVKIYRWIFISTDVIIWVLMLGYIILRIRQYYLKYHLKLSNKFITQTYLK